MSLKTIAILAPGQMGASFATNIRAVNPSIRLVSDVSGRSKRTQKLAQVAGFEDLGSLRAVLEAADVVLSVVVPDKAAQLAQDVAVAAKELVKEGRPIRTRYFVDLNAVAPSTVVKAAEAFSSVPSIAFVDGGIFGGPSTAAYAPPISLSGPPEAVTSLRAFLDPLFLGQIRTVGERVGQASALKLAFASLTKGLNGLAANAALLAEEHGISDALQEQLKSWPFILKALQERVPSATAKVRRRPRFLPSSADPFQSFSGFPMGR
jgi:putative dehydrogenase